MASNDDGTHCGSASLLEYPFTIDDTVYIAVEGWGAEQGNYILEINGMYSDIETHSSYQTLTAYPNPSKDQVYFSSGTIAKVVLIDPTGKTILKAENAKNIDVSAFEPGFYQLEMTSMDGLQQTQKLIIQ